MRNCQPASLRETSAMEEAAQLRGTIGSVSTETATVRDEGRVWRKVLYTRQPYEDNYVDPQQFLQDLRQNVNVATYEYNKVVLDTFVVIQQFSFVVFYLFVFSMMLSGRVDECALMWVNATLFTLAFVFCIVVQRQQAVDRGEIPASFTHYLMGLCRQGIPLVGVLILLSPVLQTLTVAYSNDTIVTLSSLSMFVHVLLTDYNYLNCYSERYQQNTAVNAATFGIILIASRIQRVFQSGALIMFGILCFTLSPIPRHNLKHVSLRAHVVLTFTICALAIYFLMEVPVFALLYCVVVVVISVVIPFFFVKLHGSMKDQINGPWDEAKPTNSAAAVEWANAGMLQ
ncbi:phosphatidylinositolN-acetylglucosaminyltransferase subunit c, putative [Trypanosoma brucei gambiense DAL972]|uniref:PhosphatidylinositolN-acetylglucosaminyltransferase subunit c, putative n=2 Tax=Trypanosoma brucei TaxID=5691 RepID=D0A318_TRYB9|nr:phosphatidylinositolN-acetylglucosaminyltransferase subunit c, putative [Trypanosoma brucei gambiense DAL972]RHW68705.1 phosphatidylinositolN-acetylglucosaminyltransferase [Trypanosoma brucei equiperdum]CBH15662.1 phosphatidylinositolN-acetylglucosaminyltransferase subunit c, putative [Trypanosoma brucei gambiense DAL972]|eukprot:XP_011777926.1 phosphatidylinositolN-acetylglucosaminyltransferase subunit c, putative [Trypanosoma brucei gambiense DAL972]